VAGSWQRAKVTCATAGVALSSQNPSATQPHNHTATTPRQEAAPLGTGSLGHAQNISNQILTSPTQLHRTADFGKDGTVYTTHISGLSYPGH
jgi:hypothetical protein